MAGIRPEEVQKRFDRLTEIFGGIVEHADAQASWRCPYRDRHDLCTAKFHCRNQSPAAPAREETAGEGDLTCSHDGRFDYRSAWESDPRTGERARQRLETIRERAAEGRQGRRAPRR